MRPVRLSGPFLVGTLFLGSWAAAFAVDLPEGVPMRNEGLWHMEQTGTISDGETTFDIEKTWEICLDPSADRALRELEVREQQAVLSR